MKRLLLATALVFAATGTVQAGDHGKHAKHAKHAHKEHAKAMKAIEKDRRKAWRETMKAEREWARGQALPREYLVDRYYIRDYDRYDYAPPPAGYAYVRPYPQDDRTYLVQVATGVISQILLGR